MPHGPNGARRGPAVELLPSLGPGGFAWLHGAPGSATGFVTSGELARLRPDEVAGFLGAIDVDDEVRAPGTGAIAAGALPFDPAAAGELVVPARVFGVTADGRAWRTEIGPATVVPVATRVSPTRFDVRAVDTREGWRNAVEAILAAIAAGDVEKVVLAREVVVEADEEFALPAVLGRLHAQQPGCYFYAAGDLVGASPELLVRRTGSVAESRPMAGTVARDAGDDAVAALAESVKDGREHQFVVDAIVEVLRDRCESLDVARTPEIARFSSVAHLVTPIRAVLRDPAPSALELAWALHPTPAVGGTPRRRFARPDRAAWSRAIGAATPGRSAGSTPSATASGPWPCAAARSTAAPRCCGPAPASSPAPTPTPNGPRPRPSSTPCSAPSSARNPALPSFLGTENRK